MTLRFSAAAAIFFCDWHQSDAFVIAAGRSLKYGSNQITENSLTFLRRNGLNISYGKIENCLYGGKPDQATDMVSKEIGLQEKIEALVAPVADLLQEKSDGWALSYADLTPNSEKTVAGQMFLLTNLAYTIVGIVLSLRHEAVLGFLTELCSIASFSYHFTQLQQPYGRAKDSTVRLTLLIDYAFAISAILVGLFYILVDHAVPTLEGLVTGVLGITCLLSCWVFEYGMPYIILHGMWHLFSAATGYYIGISHSTS